MLIKIAKTLFEAKIIKRRIPLVVAWAITSRCNRKCLYCSQWQCSKEELSTRQVLHIIDCLSRLGTMRIAFTGGEPLVREDIGAIVGYAHSKGLETKLNSNGALVKERIKELKKLKMIQLSLDGPEAVHDAIRGKGAYREVMEASSAAGRHGIKVAFSTVLTRINLASIDFILDRAEEFGGRVLFQPATPLVLRGQTINPMAPNDQEYYWIIKQLVHKKKKGNDVIANSLAGLKHLGYYPNPKQIRCASGYITCRIEPNGDINYCARAPRAFRPFNCINDGVQKAFNNLSPVICMNCWCAARAELNLAFCGNISAIRNQINKLV